MRLKAFWKVAVLSCTVTLAHAGLLDVTVSSTASGSFGGVPFTNQLVTLHMLEDTSGVVSGGDVSAYFGALTVNVAGMGSGTFTDMIGLVDTKSFTLAGFGDIDSGAELLLTKDPAFATYDLMTPIGPITGVASYTPGQSFPTTAGAFIIDSSGNTTFTAAATPEPTDFLLLSLGLAGIAIGLKARFGVVGRPFRAAAAFQAASGSLR